jgi:hypothetical protein
VLAVQRAGPEERFVLGAVRQKLQPCLPGMHPRDDGIGAEKAVSDLSIDDLAVFRHVRVNGPISMVELEDDPPGSLTSDRARISAQRLVSRGKLVLDDELKLAARADRCDRCDAVFGVRDDARWNGIDAISDVRYPLIVGWFWVCRCCFNDRLLEVFG